MAASTNHNWSCDIRGHPLAVEVANHFAATKSKPQMNRGVFLQVTWTEVARASSVIVTLMSRKSIFEKRYRLPHEFAWRINPALLQCTLDELHSLCGLMVVMARQNDRRHSLPGVRRRKIATADKPALWRPESLKLNQSRKEWLRLP